jgi:hypothetical protein
MKFWIVFELDIVLPASAPLWIHAYKEQSHRLLWCMYLLHRLCPSYLPPSQAAIDPEVSALAVLLNVRRRHRRGLVLHHRPLARSKLPCLPSTPCPSNHHRRRQDKCCRLLILVPCRCRSAVGVFFKPQVLLPQWEIRAATYAWGTSWDHHHATPDSCCTWSVGSISKSITIMMMSRTQTWRPR